MNYSRNVGGTLVTVLTCLCVWMVLDTFHSQMTRTRRTNSSTTTTTSSTRKLQRYLPAAVEETNDNTPVTDDITRDETCRDYLMEFLNGTTDAKDECTGMYNAFIEGDCKDTSGINNLRFLKDNNNNSSTGLIDDVFEAWECCDHIGSYYSKHCEEEELDALRLFGIVAVLIACWLAKSLLRVNGWGWIPDAGACILVGAIVGLVLRIAWTADIVNQRMIFNNNLFLQILLPPIIFEAALSIDKTAFRRDLFPILTFAIIGTGFSAVAIGYITYYVSAWGSNGAAALPFLESLLFGALMSSIDPVATLSILSSVGVGQRDTLYALVFGESLLNDGVAIVLFESLVRHMGDPDVVGRARVWEVLWHFLLNTVGSVFIGLLCGALCTFYFWIMKGQNTAVSEGALFFTWALIPYYIADALQFSGIISIMVMGFMLDYYVIGGFQDNRAEWNAFTRIDSVDTNPFNPPETFREKCNKWCNQAFSGKGHMLQHSRSHVGYVAEVISSIVETAIFAYLGLFLFNDNNGDMKLTAAGIFACVSSRAVMVVVLCAMINICVCLDMETRLTNIWRIIRARGDMVMNSRQAYESAANNNNGFLGARTQFILFTAGIRGAVSYALVQMIPVYDSVSRHGSLYKGELRAMTSATIVGVLFVFGALTYLGVDKNNNNAARAVPSSPMELDPTLSSQLLMTTTNDDGPEDHDDEPTAESFEFDARYPQPQRLG